MMLPPPRCWLLGLLSMTLLSFSMTSAKIYDRCELARELHDRFKFSKRDLDKWLCLAYWESRFDTRAYHKGRYDGSGDHGIFQINDKYWCQPYTGYSENVCKVPCYMLRDDNLEDDIQCVNKIFRRHGFHAWMMFTHKCSGNTLEFFSGCDIKSRKGPLPRYEAQSSDASPAYVRRPNQTLGDTESSSSSQEASSSSAEESIHTVGGDYSTAQAYPGGMSSSSSRGYSHHVAAMPVQNDLFRQTSVPSTVHIPAQHVGAMNFVSPSLAQGMYLDGRTLGASPFGTSALGGGHAHLSNPLGFSPDMSLFSSAITPQASQLTPWVEAAKVVPKPSKPGVIQRLQGALRTPFRVSFRTSGRTGAAAPSAPEPIVVPPAPLIPGYKAPILVPAGTTHSNLDKWKSNSLRAARRTTKRPVDPLIQALNAPFKNSQKNKPVDDSEEYQDDEENETEE